jgi:hypothetical protein
MEDGSWGFRSTPQTNPLQLSTTLPIPITTPPIATVNRPLSLQHTPSTSLIHPLLLASPSQPTPTAPSTAQTDQMHGGAIGPWRVPNPVAASGAVGSVAHVMTAASIVASKAAGYAQYLETKTITPELGDYYLTPDGEPTQAPGRWLASPETLARLGIEGEVVDGRDFVRLMEGKHPESGRWLRQEGANGQRGGGVDLTFSAP